MAWFYALLCSVGSAASCPPLGVRGSAAKFTCTTKTERFISKPFEASAKTGRDELPVGEFRASAVV